METWMVEAEKMVSRNHRLERAEKKRDELLRKLENMMDTTETVDNRKPEEESPNTSDDEKEENVEMEIDEKNMEEPLEEEEYDKKPLLILRIPQHLLATLAFPSDP